MSSTTNPLAQLANTDLAALLGVVITASKTIAANPTTTNVVVQTAALPEAFLAAVPALQSTDIAGVFNWVAEILTAKQSALTASA